MSHVTEEMVHQAFVDALNKMLQRYGGQSLIKKVLDEVFDVREVSQAIDEQKGLIARLNEELDELLVEQQTVKLSADEFSSQAQRLDAQLHDAHSLLAIKQEELGSIKAKRASITRAMRQMGEHLVTEFCPTYWMAFVEQATIFPDRIEFKMRLGCTIKQKFSSSSN